MTYRAKSLRNTSESTRRAGHEDPHRHELRVEVPDALSGFMLVQRLARGEVSGSETEGWLVRSSADGDLPHILTTIQQWLHDEAIDHVTIHIGDHTHTMVSGG